MAYPSGQPVASTVLVQCQLQRWKSLQLDMEPSPVLCCAELQIYYRLGAWTEGLTRPGISVWTCSASATLSVGSGGRSAVCKSYLKTLWCLHPARTEHKRKRLTLVKQHLSVWDLSLKIQSAHVCKRGGKKILRIHRLMLPRPSSIIWNLSTGNHNIFHINRNKKGLLLLAVPWATPEQNTIWLSCRSKKI